MTYDDRIRISTPEGVDLELILAGLGSRIGSAVVDAAIRGVVYIALTILGGAIASATGLGGVVAGVTIALVFLIEFGYDIAFETLGSGRTIGKRVSGLRVLRSDGSPVDFRSSAVRNLLRLVDGLLTGYVAGVVAILVTKRNQRLGDLAGGTIVVRDRVGHTPAGAISFMYATGEPTAAMDATAVTRDEVATLRRFLERRDQLEPAARARLASALCDRVRNKVSGLPEHVNPERLIEEIVRAKSGRD